MKKRGEFSGVVGYILIFVVSAVILLLGYVIINHFIDYKCMSRIMIIKGDIQQEFDTVERGSFKRKTYENICNADRVYFLDRSKNLSPDYFNESLILKDAVNSKSKDNVFFIKGNTLKDSFWLGDFDIEYPYYKCIEIKDNKLDIFIKGKGYASDIASKEVSLDCTYYSINPSYDDAELILGNFTKFNCSICPDDVAVLMALINQTKENVEMKRKVTCDEATNFANVEILIRVKDGFDIGNFNFYEILPKECVKEIKKDLVESIPGVDIAVKEDPLIMWSFYTVKDEQSLNYKVNTCLSDECRKLIQGLGIAEFIIPERNQSCEASEKDMCADGIDNDCDKETDYDGYSSGIINQVTHGDSECPVSIDSISINNPNPVEGTTIKVMCRANVNNVNSISAYVDSSICSFSRWVGNSNTAEFDCDAGLEGTRTVRCSVDASKSYQSGIDATKTINVKTNVCKVYSSSSDCNADNRCEWCNKCSGLKYSNINNQCFSKGECDYSCQKGECEAACSENNDDDCPDVFKYDTSVCADIGTRETLYFYDIYSCGSNCGCYFSSTNMSVAVEEKCATGEVCLNGKCIEAKKIEYGLRTHSNYINNPVLPICGNTYCCYPAGNPPNLTRYCGKNQRTFTYTCPAGLPFPSFREDSSCETGKVRHSINVNSITFTCPPASGNQDNFFKWFCRNAPLDYNLSLGRG